MITINQTCINSLITAGAIVLNILNPAPIIKETLTIPIAHAEVIEEVIDVKEEECSISEVRCNCYLYIKTKIPSLPQTKNIIPNSIYPNVGGVTIIDSKGTIHYMFNEKVEEKGVWISECNFEKGKCGKRFLTWEYLTEHNARYWYEQT